MKKDRLWKNALVVATLLAFLFPVIAGAATMGKGGPWHNSVGVIKRPISDFLKAQGTLNDPPLFFWPVKDYVGWTDGSFVTFALVDYAGLANKYIKSQTGRSLGTNARGTVTERILDNGKAQVDVALFTTRALGFAQSIEAIIANDFDFLATPTIFGAKAQDVVENFKSAAVGPATLLTSFSMPQPGANLPDFLDVINNAAQYAPVKIDFQSTTFGVRPDGAKACLEVHQVAATNAAGVLEFSLEKVQAVDLIKGHCGG